MKNQNIINFDSKTEYRVTSPRSVTPTMIIPSPRVTLANYKLMIKKSKEQSKLTQSRKPSNQISFQKLSSVSESLMSADTCLFSTPIKSDTNDMQEMKIQLEEMQKFTVDALNSQRKYFENIIFELQQEIKDNRELFNQELSIIREEIAYFKEEKIDLSVILPENQSNWDYKTQYFKNQDFIAALERQNQILYQKIIQDTPETPKKNKSK
jgi:hypothetical protein